MADNGEPTPPVAGLVPRPDPTVLTTQALEREVASVREHIASELAIRDERLRGIDKATSLRLEMITTLPAAASKEMDHIQELANEQFQSIRKMIDDRATLSEQQFESIALQFKERDTRSERESRDNKVAVDAAFAAQKEAAAKQDEANQKAIDKSEKATSESLNKLADLFKTTTDALTDKIDDIKAFQALQSTQIIAAASHNAGGQEATTEHRASAAAIYAAVGFVISLILAAIVIVGIIASRGK